MIALYTYISELKQYLSAIPEIGLPCTDICIGVADGGIFSVEVFYTDPTGEIFIAEVELDSYEIEEMSEKELQQRILADIIFAVSTEQQQFATIH